MALKRALLVASAALLVLATACSKPDRAPHRTAPWLANPSASSATVLGTRSYRFAADSSVRFSLSGRKGKLSGRLPLAEGELRLDPRDLRRTSASLSVDLTQLSIETEVPAGVELGASSPAALALQWLELGPQVPEERRAQFAKARVEITSLENLSSQLLDLGSSRKPSAVRATAIGTLLLHGFRAPLRTEVLVTTQRTQAGVERLSIRSIGGLVVTLTPHDIAARGPSGIVDAMGGARAADWLGKQARVDFELLAEPTTGAGK